MVHSCEEAQQLQTEIIQKLLSFHGFKYRFYQELMVLYFLLDFFISDHINIYITVMIINDMSLISHAVSMMTFFSSAFHGLNYQFNF